MTHFVLAHGGWHDAWCWEPLIAELGHWGHEATAVSMPTDVPGRGAQSYAEVLAAAVVPEGSVIVGHSLAGLALPLVPHLASVRACVYLAALLPDPGRSWRDQLRDKPMADWFYSNALQLQQRDEQQRTFWSAKVASELFFHDCADDVAARSAARLRPQASDPVAERSPVLSFPEVPTHYVMGRDDRAVSTTWAAAAARDRLGVEPIWIEGGHSPFLSRPAQLADLLAGLDAARTPDHLPNAEGAIS